MTYIPPHHPDVVVIVGADIELLDIIKTILSEEAQMRVLIATAPELAMPLIESAAPGIIILDLNLPEQSGWNILAAVRGHPHFGTLPVLMLTAANEDAARVAASGDSRARVLLHPFDLDVIVQQVQYLLNQYLPGPQKAQQQDDATEKGISLPIISRSLLSGDTGK